MSFRKIAPLAKPAPKHEVHKQAKAVTTLPKKTVKKARTRPVAS
jgi:hypothetical protein